MLKDNILRKYKEPFVCVLFQNDQVDGDPDLDELERQLKSEPDYGMEWSLKEIEDYLEASPPESPPEKRRASGMGVLRPMSPVLSAATMTLKTPPRTSRSASPLMTSSPSRSRSPSRYANRSPVRSPRNLSPARSTRSTRSISPTRSLSPSRSPRHYPSNYSPPRLSREERWKRLQQELPLKMREADVESVLEKLVDALEDAKDKLRVVEREVRTGTPTGPGFDQRSADYVSKINKFIELRHFLLSSFITDS